VETSEPLRDPEPSSWVHRQRGPLLFGLAAAAILVRLAFVLQMANGPGFHQHRWSESDMAFFQSWARIIVEGDRLTDRALHPYHPWHERVAQRYFRSHPGERERWNAEAGDPGSAGRVLWNHWYGGKRFHQEPLYPYVIAVLEVLPGTAFGWTMGLQVLAGLVICLLIHRVTERLFGEPAAVVAAGLSVLCGPLIFYELQLLRATLLVLLGLLSVWLTLRALDRNRWQHWALLGGTCGVAILLKSTLALYALGLLAGLFVLHRRNPQRLLASAGPLLAGLLICLSPAIVRNLNVGVSPFGLTSVGTIGLIFANADGASASGYSFLIEHGAEIMGRSDGRLLPAALASLSTHDGPWSYLGLMAERLGRIAQGYEVPNNTNFYFCRLHAPVLHWLPVGFGFLSPLALAGGLLAARRFRHAWPLYLLGTASMVPLMAYGNLSRYRLLLLASAIPLAALGLTTLVRAVAARKIRFAVTLGAVLLLAGAWTTGEPPRPRLRAIDFVVADQVYYRPLREEAARRGDGAGVLRVFRRLLALEPAENREIGTRQPPRTRFASRLAGFYGEVYRDYGYALSRNGRPDEARVAQRRAGELLRAAALPVR